MIFFEPVEYREKIGKVVNKFSFLSGSIEDIDFSQFKSIEELESEYYDDREDICINEHASVQLNLDECNDVIIDLAELLRIFDCYDELILNKAQSYARSNHEVFFLLDGIDYDTYEFLYSIERQQTQMANSSRLYKHMFSTTINVEGNQYALELYKGFCFYHLLVEESENYNEYYPSYSEDDVFIHVTGTPNMNMKVADSLALSYIFELQTTLNLSLAFSKGRTQVSSLYFVERKRKQLSAINTFPLLYGKGIPELLKLYNAAKETQELDYKILGFTKVVEYIAPTIAKSKLLEDVSLKLTSPLIFSPSPNFIEELGDIFRVHSNDTNNDSELIRIAIIKTISLQEIWSIFPNYLKRPRDAKLNDFSEDMQSKWLNNLAEAIYNTRNEIAHAKANYIKKGSECPEKEKAEFSELLDYIAVRCIRWFALQPEAKRVLS